jgi:hypothetical protein
VTLYDYSASLYAKKRNYKQSGGKNNCTDARRVHASDFNLVFVPRCTSTPPFMAARLLIGNNLLAALHHFPPLQFAIMKWPKTLIIELYD